MSHIQQINTVFVYVRDLKAARDFYETVLGFGEPVIDTKFWVEYALPGGNTHFALHPKEPGFFESRDHAQQFMKCSIEVQDIHGYAQLLQTRGVRFLFGPRKDYGFWLAEFVDADGNCLRLYEKMKKQSS